MHYRPHQQVILKSQSSFDSIKKPLWISAKRFEPYHRFPGSKQAASALFLLLCLSLVPENFAETGFQVSRLSRFILSCIGLNLIPYTTQRIKTIARPVYDPTRRISAPSPIAIIICLTVLLFLPCAARAAVIQSDTTWSREVSLDEDILVPEGVTLTISPGTTVRITPAESTKTDPEFLSPLTEITVRGTLVADGKEGMPVSFVGADQKNGHWAGVIIDGGKAVIRSSVISDAETGISVVHGSLSMTDSVITKNRYGLTVQGADSAVRLRSCRIKKNDYGVFLLNGARIENTGCVVQGNGKKDTYFSPKQSHQWPEKDYTTKADKREKSRIYRDEVLLGTTVWQGRIEVDGTVRVPENSRLIILPGTVVEFRRKDTNSDGIGENGLLIQGMIVAKGTQEKPIIFRSGEKHRRMGDWDSINIMNSDKGQNLIEYCQIEDAYRGLHFHFSQVAVSDSIIKNNYRGIQFQESVVEIKNSRFYRNKSAFQARDSDIAFTDNVISGNYAGMNIFRNSITVKGNVIVNNEQEGLRIREGLPVVEGNLLYGNRHGIMVSDAAYGAYNRNVITHNVESGISLRGTDTIEISGNAVQASGMNGINIQDSSASIQGNLISDNLERGIGVQSFQGVIAGNNILKNGLYNLGVDGSTDVAAGMNWWGGEDVKRTVYDKEDDPTKGKAELQPVREKPAQFAWPLAEITTDTAWHGDIAVDESITVEPGNTLAVSPNTTVLFSKGRGITVKGKILARGERNGPVTFKSSEGKGPAEWDEILLDHAQGSAFTNCTFQNATWALHSHFTDLKVERCVFVNNGGGLRFTSGPIEVRHSYFAQNDVGIRAFRGSAVISGNVITENAVGIFVREKGGGLSVRKNNLFGNTDYNIRIGDFNDEDVDAKENWWGDPVPIDKIYDARSEPGIGLVKYVPYAKKPFALDLSASAAQVSR